MPAAILFSRDSGAVRVKLTTDTLENHLGRTLLPAYLICGDEPLLAAEAADAVRKRARAAGFTEREVHFIERAADWDDVRASAGTLSLFGARRLLEVRLASARPGTSGSATLTWLLERTDPDTLLLILSPRLDRDAQASQWARAAQSHGAWVQVWPVETGRFPAWLRARSRRIGVELGAEALQVLAERTEGNLLAADQELRKLALLGGRDGGGDAVHAGVADSARFDVFRLSDAVLAGQPARSLRVLAGLRAEGTEPTLVLWALTRALRDLSGALTGSAGRPAGRWRRPNAALDAAVRRSRSLSLPDLMMRAARVDRMIKGRLRGDPWDEMALLATDLCGRPAVPAPQSMFK